MKSIFSYDYFLKQKNALITIFILTLFFVLSIAARESYIEKQFSDKGWVSAHTLTTVSIWQEEGPRKFNFSPVYTFNNQGDKDYGILGGVKDSDNRFYYVSYPPMTFIAPYVFFSLTGIEADENGLRYFNLMLHFIAALLLYSILLKLVNKTWNDPISVPALFVYLLYLFSSGTLFFHSEIYFADILVQPLFLAQIFHFIKWKQTGVNADFYYLLFFSALAIYTEWIGLFTLFVMTLFILFEKKQNFKEKLIKIVWIGVITFFVLGLTIYQYSSISGWDNLYQASVQKYEMRSGHSGVEGSEHGLSFSNPESWNYLSGHINGWFLQIINLIGIILPLWIGLMIFTAKARLKKQEYGVLLLLISPLIIHFLVFFNFNVVHDMGSLKLMTIAMIILGIAVYKIVAVFQNQSKWMLYTAISAIMILNSFKMYQSVNRYRERIATHFHSDFQKKLGEAIQLNSPKEDFVFTNAFIGPELMFYSQRNVRFTNDTISQQNLMKDYNINSSIFFQVDGENLVGVYRKKENTTLEKINPRQKE